MAGNDLQPDNPYPISARFFLWTIRQQDSISRCISVNMWSSVSAVLAISLAGLITIEMALQIIFVGGLAAGIFIWILIERRRSWLLGISDPKLKAAVHRMMIEYLIKKLCPGPECRKRLKSSDARPIA